MNICMLVIGLLMHARFLSPFYNWRSSRNFKIFVRPKILDMGRKLLPKQTHMKKYSYETRTI